MGIGVLAPNLRGRQWALHCSQKSGSSKCFSRAPMNHICLGFPVTIAASLSERIIPRNSNLRPEKFLLRLFKRRRILLWPFASGVCGEKHDLGIRGVQFGVHSREVLTACIPYDIIHRKKTTAFVVRLCLPLPVLGMVHDTVSPLPLNKMLENSRRCSTDWRLQVFAAKNILLITDLFFFSRSYYLHHFQGDVANIHRPLHTIIRAAET